MSSMRLRVLGCSGGIGECDQRHPAQRNRTSSFLLDDDILIDAGTGVTDLTVGQLTRIDHVFLSHSHLDHICSLPLMVDSVGALRDKPLIVHALPETIAALRAHIFNWVIWPDFSVIPDAVAPWMAFAPIGVGQVVRIGGRSIRAIAANHTVPALGFHIAHARGSIVYSGDTWPQADFWATVNAIDDLRALIIETAFANREQDLARTARHLFPGQLGHELEKLRGRPRICITHLKPSDAALIAGEIADCVGRFSPEILQSGSEIVVD